MSAPAKWTVRWFFKAVRDRVGDFVEKPVRNTGAFLFRLGVDAARATGTLPRPRLGEGILVINLTSHFGDAVMLLPMLEAIHQHNPAIPIDVACTRGIEAIFEAIPFIRSVYAAPLPTTPPVKLHEAITRRIAILRWYRTDLLQLHPAACLMPRWGDDLFASLYLAYLIGAPARIAYSSTVDPYQRNAPQRDRLLTQRGTGGAGLHEPLRFLHLAQQASLIDPAYTMRTDQPSATLQGIAASVPWQPLQQRLNLPQSKPWIVLAPGASRPNKTWPINRWIAAAEQLLAQKYDIVLLSGKPDQHIAEAIAKALSNERVHLVAGTTSLIESIALLGRASGFLGNDSGPGHAAGALGIPTVILFASAPTVYPDHSLSPVRIRPMGPYVQTLQPAHLLEGCRHACVTDAPHCIKTIPVEGAIVALTRMLPGAEVV